MRASGGELKLQAFVFPGQGSQYSGMGNGLIQQSWSQPWLSQASEILGWDISRLLAEGTEEELARTAVTQPAMFVVDYLYFDYLRQQGVGADMMAGHSLGELVALSCSAALDFGTGLELVKIRTKLMDEAVARLSGKMLAIIGLSLAEVSNLVSVLSDSGTIVVANYNSPAQTVISGEAALVERAAALAVESGAKKAVELAVGGAFHSPLMAEAAEKFALRLEEVEFREASVPVVSNYTAKASRNGAALKDALKKQMTGPVRWQASVESMVSAGVDKFVEVGPGRVLRGLIRRIDAKLDVEEAELLLRTF